MAYSQHTIINENQFSQNQPILLPAMEEFGMEPYTPSISLQLEDMDLPGSGPYSKFLDAVHLRYPYINNDVYPVHQNKPQILQDKDTQGSKQRNRDVQGSASSPTLLR
ncbi:hypothetical protein JTB14_015570 [Gonioctena quinquepunctata]|nr:hypothetical protein JTB14_015570 [Gonioctena quinquepunctata]